MLSLVLRHNPKSIGITLDENGWTDVKVLTKQMSQHGFNINKKILSEIVESNDKERFAFNDDKTKIRANQGHSVKIDLGYPAKTPPQVLFHGTGSQFLESILASGLSKKSRHHVHLSPTIETAQKVGQRKGKPIVLIVEALQMHEDGYKFFISDNNVWLTEHVPAQYLKLHNELIH